MITVRYRPLLMAAALALLIGALALLVLSRARLNPAGSDLSRRQVLSPASIEEIVAHNDVIMAGTLDSISGTFKFRFPFDPGVLADGSTPAPNEPGAAEFYEPGPEVENIEYLFTVDEVFLDDGMVGSVITATLRKGYVGDESYVAPFVGERYLVFASHAVSPTSTIYRPNSAEDGMIIASDPVGPVQYAYGQPVPYAVGLTYEEFELAVIAEIAAQHGQYAGDRSGPETDAAGLGLRASPPTSIEGTVRATDIIVIGTAIAVSGTTTIDYGIYIPEEGIEDPFNLDVTDLEVEVESTLLDDGTIASGGPFIVRVLTEDFDGGHPPQLGDKYLMLANRNVEDPGVSHSFLFNPQLLFDVEGPDVLYADGSPVPFAVGMTPQEFIDAVVSEVVAQHNPYPIYSSQDAISRTLDHYFPPKLTPVDPIARLVEYRDFLNIARPTPIPYTDPSYDRLVWVVAVRAVDAKLVDLGMSSGYDYGATVDGYYYEWDASRGALHRFGGLDPEPQWLSWQSIYDLVSLEGVVQITPDTSPPPTMDLRSEHTPPAP